MNSDIFNLVSVISYTMGIYCSIHDHLCSVVQDMEKVDPSSNWLPEMKRLCSQMDRARTEITETMKSYKECNIPQTRVNADPV